jgi:Flp pilus assembly protein TadD
MMITSGCYDTPEARQKRKKSLLVQGSKAYLAGDWETSLKAQREVVKMNPSDLQQQYLLANTLIKAGKFEEAKEILKKVADSDDLTFAKISNKRLQELEIQGQ